MRRLQGAVVDRAGALHRESRRTPYRPGAVAQGGAVVDKAGALSERAYKPCAQNRVVRSVSHCGEASVSAVST